MTTQLKPRRKWGWFFVLALVVQAIAFPALIGEGMNNLKRERDLLSSFARQAAQGGPNSDRLITESIVSGNRIRARQSELSVLMTLGGICLAGTLAGAVMGLRRRKYSPQTLRV